MSPTSSVSDNSIRSKKSNASSEPCFKPWSSPPEESSVMVQPNEVHLIPLLKSRHKLEVAAKQGSNRVSSAPAATSPSPKHLIDDLIIISSRAGVIFGRIPNSLSDAGLEKWLKSFVHYINTSEQAVWWHTDHSGPWACYVFVPMDSKRTKWLYSNTEDDKSRPLTILNTLDKYVEEKPWLRQLPGMEQAEKRVADIHGICYVPTPNISKRQKLQESKSTKISFLWDPEKPTREVRLSDRECKDELLERVNMSLI